MWLFHCCLCEPEHLRLGAGGRIKEPLTTLLSDGGSDSDFTFLLSLRPNNSGAVGEFDSKLVLAQIKKLGLSAVAVSRKQARSRRTRATRTRGLLSQAFLRQFQVEC